MMSVFLVLSKWVALAIIAVLLTALAWRLRRENRVKVPSCPQCFYNVTGLQSGICPECGADLARVGYLAPGRVKPLSRFAVALMTTLFLASVAWLTTPMILRAIPSVWALNAQVTLSQPQSRTHSQVVIDGSHTFRTVENGRAKALTLTLHRTDGSTSMMHVDFASMMCQFRDATGQSTPQPLSFEGDQPLNLILHWFAASGIAELPDVRHEADQIAAVLRNHHSMRARMPQMGLVRGEDVFTGAPGMSTQMNSSSFNNMQPYMSVRTVSRVGRAPDPVALPASIAAWGLLWLIAMAIVWWLKRPRGILLEPAPTMSANPVIQGISS